METQINTMAMDDSYMKSLAAFRKRNGREVVANTLSKISTDVKLGSVRSCLAVGPGEGRYDIEFIRHCAANTSKFIGVEFDRGSAEHLKTSLRSSLPSVESQVFETYIQNWDGPGIPVDLVTMFHVLYYIEAGERQQLLKKVHDSWLVSGGYVAVLTARRTKAPNSADIVHERLGCWHPTYDDIEAEFLKAGFTKHYEHEMHWTRDLSGPCENLVPFYQLLIKDRVLTVDELRDAMKGLISPEKADVFQVLAIFKSTN